MKFILLVLPVFFSAPHREIPPPVAQDTVLALITNSNVLKVMLYHMIVLQTRGEIRSEVLTSDVWYNGNTHYTEVLISP
jgi:hypothetical protein